MSPDTTFKGIPRSKMESSQVASIKYRKKETSSNGQINV